MPTATWWIREASRLDNGEYKALPWALSLGAITNHFAHISTNNEHMVAFTENEQKGRKDIQTIMKPGRYLRRFYPDMSDVDVARYAALMNGADIKDGEHSAEDLKFAYTEDEIQWVYDNGPHSCMCDTDGMHTRNYHPVRAYSGPDLAVAYVLNARGNPAARAVVWPAKKRFYTIYGDGGAFQQKLPMLLGRQDYERMPFYGARLKKVSHGKDNYGNELLICPYIDGPEDMFVEVTKKYLVITKHKRGFRNPELHSCKSTTGYMDSLENIDTCEECGEDCNPDDMSEGMCPQCYDDTHEVCNVCGKPEHIENFYLPSSTLHINTNMCEKCFDSLTTMCTECKYDDTYMKSDMTRIGADKWLCKQHTEDLYFKCLECGQLTYIGHEDEDMDLVCTYCTGVRTAT